LSAPPTIVIAPRANVVPAFAKARRAVSLAFAEASADLMRRSFAQIVLKVLGENLNRSESAGRPAPPFAVPLSHSGVDPETETVECRKIRTVL
jgi:hypothetical protein